MRLQRKSSCTVYVQSAAGAELNNSSLTNQNYVLAFNAHAPGLHLGLCMLHCSLAYLDCIVKDV